MASVSPGDLNGSDMCKLACQNKDKEQSGQAPLAVFAAVAKAC